MRAKLQEARRVSGLTQEQVAHILGITTRHYQRIEKGDCSGKVQMWDALEQMFGIAQKDLRRTEILPDTPAEVNREKGASIWQEW